MFKVECTRCGGVSEAETLELATSRIDHGSGRGHGISCGTSIGKVRQIPDPNNQGIKTERKIKKQEKPKIEKTKSKTVTKEKYL